MSANRERARREFRWARVSCERGLVAARRRRCARVRARGATSLFGEPWSRADVRVSPKVLSTSSGFSVCVWVLSRSCVCVEIGRPEEAGDQGVPEDTRHAELQSIAVGETVAAEQRYSAYLVFRIASRVCRMPRVCRECYLCV